MNETTIVDLLGIRDSPVATKDTHRWNDLFGLEFEVEGLIQGLDYEDTDYWVAHRDGSLVDGREYVLNGAMQGTKLNRALNVFYNGSLQAAGGLRTSTHVHINGRDLTLGQLRSIMILMYTLEDDLFRVIGEDRKWCGYAMGLSEMEPKRLSGILSDTDRQKLQRHFVGARGGDRYYGLNILSLARHGSVEFRYFPGMPTRPEVEDWLDFVLQIKRAAQATPVDRLTEDIDSEDKLNNFLREALPGNLGQRMLSTGSPIERWTLFNKVTAMIQDAPSYSRTDRLVRITPQLINALVKKKMLTPVGADYLKKVGQQLKVMTVRDYNSYYNHATTLSGSKTKAKPAPAAGAGGPDDYYSNVIRELQAQRTRPARRGPEERYRVNPNFRVPATSTRPARTAPNQLFDVAPSYMWGDVPAQEHPNEDNE